MVIKPIAPPPSDSADAASPADSAPSQPEAAPDREIALYIAHMTGEMAAMARTSGYDMLAYFLDMARIEARIQAEARKT